MSIETKRDSETRHLLRSISTSAGCVVDAWRCAWIDDEFVSWFGLPASFFFAATSKPHRKGATIFERFQRARESQTMLFRLPCIHAGLENFWTMLLVLFQYFFVVASCLHFASMPKRGEGVGSGSMIHSAFLFCSVFGFDQIRRWCSIGLARKGKVRCLEEEEDDHDADDDEVCKKNDFGADIRALLCV